MNSNLPMTMRATCVSRSLLVLVSTLLTSACLCAQSPSLDLATAGRQFIITVPDTTGNLYDLRFNHQNFSDSVWLYMYAAVDTRVTVTGSNLPHPTLELKAAQFTRIALTAENGIPNPFIASKSNVVANTVRLDADNPIVLYCYVLTGFGSEAWTPLPCEAWGTDYFVSAISDEIGHDVLPGGSNMYLGKNKLMPAEFTVTALADSTVVTINPNGKIQFPGRLEFMLMANQAVQIKSNGDTALASMNKNLSDIGGTRVHADKPIGVVSGNSRAMLFEATHEWGFYNPYKNLMIESLTPTDLHGTEFVYLPTWDSRTRMDTVGEDLNGKRRGELVRVFGRESEQMKGVVRDGNNPSVAPFASANIIPGVSGIKYHDSVAGNRARWYLTDSIAQAFKFSPGVGRVATKGFFSSEVYGGSMVEMVPRKNWSSFGPFFTPKEPSGMEHFISVVTDTASRNKILLGNNQPFQFNNGIIPGTDLIWGSMQLEVGTTDHLYGVGGAKFYGIVYGQRKGVEEYLPQTSGPAPYNEVIGLGYSYAIAPSRNVYYGSDSLRIGVTTDSCGRTTITIDPFGPFAGLRAIHFDPLTTTNTRLEFIEPQSALELVARVSKTIVRISPQDFTVDGSWTCNIVSRTGRKWTLQGSSAGRPMSIVPAPNIAITKARELTPIDTVITVTNLSSTPLSVDGVSLSVGTTFAMSSVLPALPTTLAQGNSLTVSLRALPAARDKIYRDTLAVLVNCTSKRIPLSISTKGDTTSAVDEAISSESKLAVAPNPANGYLTVRGMYGTASHIQMVNALGVVVMLSDINNATLANDLRVDVRNVPQGVYWIQVLSKDGFVVARTHVVIAH